METEQIVIAPPLSYAFARLQGVLVAEGNGVTMGQMIGHTGETGVTEDGTLYFELRKGTTPIDPLKWLAKR